jgi:hypothetical protein|eukprot:COSAG02_NODE_17450_length_1002_cov_1.353267_1_plen_116_part_00
MCSLSWPCFPDQVLLEEAAAQGRQNASSEGGASGLNEDVDLEAGQSGVAEVSSGEASANEAEGTAIDETTPIVNGDDSRPSDDATSLTTAPANATGFQEDDPDDDDAEDGTVVGV